MVDSILEILSSFFSRDGRSAATENLDRGKLSMQPIVLRESKKEGVKPLPKTVSF